MAAAQEEDRLRRQREAASSEWEEQEQARLEHERRVLKDKIQRHREERDAAAVRRRDDEARLAALMAKLAQEKSKENASRVEFRRQELRHKAEEVRLSHELECEREREREKRLERLRAQVEVHAVVDSERTRGPTVASQSAAAAAASHRDAVAARRGDVRSDTLHGYTRDNLDKDQRVRIEVALRAKGLHSTEYGRQVIRSLPPPTAPRRGLESSVFKSDTSS